MSSYSYTGTVGTATLTAGTYTFVLSGASGGSGNGLVGGIVGGKGRVVVARFTLTSTTSIQYVIGSQGDTTTYPEAGGGATYVYDVTNSRVLFVAGGGGGPSSTGAVGGDAGSTVSPGSGGGGSQGGGNYPGAGGAGVYGNGGDNYPGDGSGGKSFLVSASPVGSGTAVGGTNGGGFGGGAGTFISPWGVGGAGGGGYTGGSGASGNQIGGMYAGLGGTSYAISGATVTTDKASNSGNGSLSYKVEVGEMPSYSYTGTVGTATLTAGTYSFVLSGASGGGGSGLGRSIVATYTLSSPITVQYVIGGAGVENSAGTGGGATYIYDVTNSRFLFVAGGGGGATINALSGGNAGSTASPGSGGGGGSLSTVGGGAGGGGVYGDGTDATGNPNSGGKSFFVSVSPVGTGGSGGGVGTGGSGGFGGGGGVGYMTFKFAVYGMGSGGGGGGYTGGSGGGGNSNSGYAAGAGGTSYAISGATVTTDTASNNGNGSLSITLITCTTSPTGATVCSCPIGQYPVGGTVCVLCPSGTYNSSTGASSCTVCPAGTYNSSPGSTSVSSCTACSAGTYSAAGASSCTTCPTGTYSSSTGSISCSSVPANAVVYYGILGGMFFPTGFQCNQGYGPNTTGTQCVSCSAGTYSATGMSCTTCSAGSYSAAGASSCTVCPAGTYNSSTGSTSVSSCTACSAGSYSAAGASSCTVCPAGTHNSSTGSTSVSSCTACSAGSYSAAGASSCTTCSAGTYSAVAGASSCSSPPANSTVNATYTGFTCNVSQGYLRNGSTCVAASCPAGSYINVDVCTQCPSGQYSTSINVSSCSSPPAGGTVNSTQTGFTCTGNSTAFVSAGTCACNPGTYVNGTVCTTCPSSTYASGYNNTQCTQVPQYSTVSSDKSTFTCNSGFSPVSGQCQCPVGSYINGSVCTSCPVGQYSSTVNSSTCTLPPSNANVNSTQTGYLCNLGWVLQSDGTCSPLACQPGTYLVSTLNYTATSNVTNYSCAPCSLNTWSSTINANACTAVPTNSTVNAKNTGWTCNTGYISVNSSCVQGSCPVGTYQNVNTSCTQLPPNSTITSDGKYFQCNTGYVLSNGTCVSLSASGGNISQAGNNYVIHKFTTNASFVPQNANLVVDILIVGQGGSNGGNGGTITYIPGYSLSTQSYTVQVTATQSSFGSFVSVKGADQGGLGAGGPSGTWGRGPGLSYDTSGYSVVYGAAGGNSGLSGAPQTGNGGDVGLTGGSGVVYVRYLAIPCITGNVWDSSTQTCVNTCPTTLPFTKNGFCVTCTSGYLSGSTCVTACPPGTYGSKGTCIQCPGAQTSPSGSSYLTQCQCPVNYYGAFGQGTCTACPQNYVSPVGTTTSSGCTLSCPAGTYTSGTNCVTCPSPTTSSPVGSTSLNACVCPNNNVLSQGTCVSTCPVNTYALNNVCTPCPGTQISPSGSTQLSACVCPSTSYGTSGSGTCTSCPANQVANSSQTGCTCPSTLPNWDPIASWCVSQCPVNTYALNGTCTLCPNAKNSPVGSTSVSQCTCLTILAPFNNGVQCVSLTDPGNISATSGGTITYNNQTVIHTFTSNGTFVPPTNITNATVYVIGGGAGGGNDGSGGVGGSISTYTNASFTAGTSYTVTIGSGGTQGQSGGSSTIGNYTANGGSGTYIGSGTSYAFRFDQFNYACAIQTTNTVSTYVPASGSRVLGTYVAPYYVYRTVPWYTQGVMVYPGTSNADYTIPQPTTTPGYPICLTGTQLPVSGWSQGIFEGTSVTPIYVADIYRSLVQGINQTATGYEGYMTMSGQSPPVSLGQVLTRGTPTPASTIFSGLYGASGGTINYGSNPGAGTGVTLNSQNWDNTPLGLPFTDFVPATWAPANSGGGGGAGWVNNGVINAPGGAGGSGIVIVTYPQSDECPSQLPFYDWYIGKCTSCLLFNYQTPAFNPSSGMCGTCPSSTPWWNEELHQCVSTCTGDLSFYNSQSMTCVRNTPQSCPPSAPYWNTYDCSSSNPQISIYGGATGGSPIINNGTYIVHTFTTNSLFVPVVGLVADILIVGGGGGGGNGPYIPGGQSAYVYGGGGGGQVQFIPNVTLNVGTSYPVVIGQGGLAGQNGGSSSFGTYTSIGGEAGGGGTYPSTGNGGGGNASYVYAPPVQNWGTVSTAYGGTGQNYGGNSYGLLTVVNGQNILADEIPGLGIPAVSVTLAGGGGAGANGAGLSGTNTGVGGSGGPGIPYDMTGVASNSPVYYGSGGGGTGTIFNIYIGFDISGSIIVSGGLFGGGSGARGTGGGGGDGGNAFSSGSNGIVIVRYRVGYACPTSIYHYNPSTNLCTLCDPTTPYYNTTTSQCTTCPSATPYFDGLSCVATCPPQLPNPDIHNLCTLPCVNQYPYWESVSKMCVSKCPSTNPVVTGTTCGPCPSGTAWNIQTSSCGTCPEAVVNSVCTLCSDINILTPVWNGTACVRCSSGSFWNGTTCTTCAGPTVYQSSTNSCVTCFQINPLTPVFNYISKTCTSCVGVWNGSTCLSCAQNNLSTPYWNGSACAVCPTAKPIWYQNQCTSVQQVPLGPMTSSTSYDAAGNIYIVSSSSGTGWQAFDGNSSTSWQVGSASYTPNVQYSGIWGKLDDTGTQYAGEFVQIQLPLLYCPVSYTIASSSNPPTAWTVLGSTDLMSWHLLDTRSGITNLSQTFVITGNPGYNTFSSYVFIIQKSSGNQPSISEITLQNVGIGATPAAVLAANQTNILNSAALSGCTTSACVIQKASTVDITSIVYGVQPPVDVAQNIFPPDVQALLSNCNSNVQCNVIAYDFLTNTNAVLPNIPYIVDTSATTFADSGVFVKQIASQPAKLQSPPGFMFNYYGSLQGTQLRTPASPITLTACGSACYANPACIGINYNQTTSSCQLFSSVSSYSNQTDPNYNISFVRDPYILTSSGTPTATTQVCINPLACNSDIQNLLNNGVTAFSTAEINSCMYCPIRAVTQQGGTYYFTNESNVVTTTTSLATVISNMQFPFSSTNAPTHMGTSTSLTVDWPGNGALLTAETNSQGIFYTNYYLQNTGVIDTFYYSPVNFQDRIQLRISPYQSQGTVIETVTLWDMSATQGPDALASPWLQNQYSNGIRAYVLVSTSTGKTYSAGNPGMYGPTILTTDQPSGRNPNYSIFHIIPVGSIQNGYYLKSIGTNNSDPGWTGGTNTSLYQPYLKWSTGQTLPIQGSGSWYTGSQIPSGWSPHSASDSAPFVFVLNAV